MSITAMKMALEALEESQTDNDTMEFWERKSKAITSLREALAQPEQEPCLSADPSAMRPDFKCPEPWCGLVGQCRRAYKPGQTSAVKPSEVALVLSVRNEAGGTYHDLDWVTDLPDGEYNFYTQPPTQPVDKGPWAAGFVKGEPRRVFVESDTFKHDVRLYVDGDFASDQERLSYAFGIARMLNEFKLRGEREPPAQRQPLTDEQVVKIVDAHTSDDHGYDIWTDGRAVARAVEAAHGIGDKT